MEIWKVEYKINHNDEGNYTKLVGLYSTQTLAITARYNYGERELFLEPNELDKLKDSTAKIFETNNQYSPECIIIKEVDIDLPTWLD